MGKRRPLRSWPPLKRTDGAIWLLDAPENLPFRLQTPETQTAPVVFTSPHSGRNYSPEFISSTRLDHHTLRRSEDCSFCDANREAWELDPEMFVEQLPTWVNTTSARARSGLGTIARIVANNEPIYRRKLAFAEVRERIANCWIPFHLELQRLTRVTKAAFGVCLIVDCHSMPASSARSWAPDFIVGDAHGTSCAPELVETLEACLRDLGYRVARNAPYAGGYITKHYGEPRRRTHAVQLEVARGLYMDERTLKPTVQFALLKTSLDIVIRELVRAASALR
jgi:N-formylglutamate amidohydrolase